MNDERKHNELVLIDDLALYNYILTSYRYKHSIIQIIKELTEKDIFKTNIEKNLFKFLKIVENNANFLSGFHFLNSRYPYFFVRMSNQFLFQTSIYANDERVHDSIENLINNIDDISLFVEENKKEKAKYRLHIYGLAVANVLFIYFFQSLITIEVYKSFVNNFLGLGLINLYLSIIVFVLFQAEKFLCAEEEY